MRYEHFSLCKKQNTWPTLHKTLLTASYLVLLQKCMPHRDRQTSSPATDLTLTTRQHNWWMRLSFARPSLRQAVQFGATYCCFKAVQNTFLHLTTQRTHTILTSILFITCAHHRPPLNRRHQWNEHPAKIKLHFLFSTFSKSFMFLPERSRQDLLLYSYHRILKKEFVIIINYSHSVILVGLTFYNQTT
jgi:hypothetical protein